MNFIADLSFKYKTLQCIVVSMCLLHTLFRSVNDTSNIRKCSVLPYQPVLMLWIGGQDSWGVIIRYPAKTQILLTIVVSLDITSYSLVEIYVGFGGKFCLHFQGGVNVHKSAKRYCCVLHSRRCSQDVALRCR
jgi:hypothetical protein